LIFYLLCFIFTKFLPKNNIYYDWQN